MLGAERDRETLAPVPCRGEGAAVECDDFGRQKYGPGGQLRIQAPSHTPTRQRHGAGIEQRVCAARGRGATHAADRDQRAIGQCREHVAAPGCRCQMACLGRQGTDNPHYAQWLASTLNGW